MHFRLVELLNAFKSTLGALGDFVLPLVLRNSLRFQVKMTIFPLTISPRRCSQAASLKIHLVSLGRLIPLDLFVLKEPICFVSKIMIVICMVLTNWMQVKSY